MANKNLLRILRDGSVINDRSKPQEKDIDVAVNRVAALINKKFGVEIIHENNLYLHEIVRKMSRFFSEVNFYYELESSYLKPDGGILYISDLENNKYPILISEVKNQGTNDLRILEGKNKQSKGNAIERLGKNVIGLRAFLLNESIFPFVCFGYGCDFEEGSSIRDRVVTMSIFGQLCTTYLYSEGVDGKINRGSFYFRELRWEVDDMCKIMYDIANRSVLYYASKYGGEKFGIAL